MNVNPLKQYFRQVKLYIKLPSYNTGFSNYATTKSGEVGIMPMTGQDEIALKNPDALLNGEALISVIKSCAPSIVDPTKLLSNDIDALITAIRYATYQDNLETLVNCPECKKANTFKIDISQALDNMTYLEPEYVVNLDSGLSVFVKPHGFNEVLKGLHAQFEQSKLMRAIENNEASGTQRTDIFKKTFVELTRLTVELTCSSIVKIVSEANDINVTEQKFIRDWLMNIDKVTADKIQEKIREINLIGIMKKFNAVCDGCGREWQIDIDFNPTNFSSSH